MERTTSEKNTYLCTAIYIAWIKEEGVCVSGLPLFVLGERGNLYKVLSASTDLNDVTENGIYTYNNITNFTNLPSDCQGTSASCVLTVMQYTSSSSGVSQILQLTDRVGLYSRYKSSGGTWSEWKVNAYNNLSTFASLLGAGSDSGHIVHLIPTAIQGGTYTINKGLHQAILFITTNKNGNASMPSVFVIPRNNSLAIQTIYEGNCIQLSNLSMNEDGGIVISGMVNVHLYYRLYDMELIL